MCEQLVYDCALLSYYEQKTATPILLLPGQKVSTRKYFPDYLTNEDIDIPMFELNYPNRINLHIRRILTLGNGKLTLFGDSIYYSLCSNQKCREYKLYFHSCDTSEMEAIIKQSIEVLMAIGNNNIIKTYDYVKVTDTNKSIIFYTNIYKDQQSILRAIRHSTYKIGWNPINGYICTIVAGVILSLLFCEEHHPINIDMYYDEPTPNINKILFDKYKYFREIKENFIDMDVLSIVFRYWLELLIHGATERLISY